MRWSLTHHFLQLLLEVAICSNSGPLQECWAHHELCGSRADGLVIGANREAFKHEVAILRVNEQPAVVVIGHAAVPTEYRQEATSPTPGLVESMHLADAIRELAFSKVERVIVRRPLWRWVAQVVETDEASHWIDITPTELPFAKGRRAASG